MVTPTKCYGVAMVTLKQSICCDGAKVGTYANMVEFRFKWNMVYVGHGLRGTWSMRDMVYEGHGLRGTWST